MKHDIRLRRLFENLVRTVVLDANPILKTLIVAGYYIPKIKTLRLASTLEKDELFLAAYGALLHHLHPKTSIEKCHACARDVLVQVPKRDIEWAITYLQDRTSSLSVV
jgi:hypothetical protein